MVLVDRGTFGSTAGGAVSSASERGGRERITVRMLLDHTSGLPAYLAFHRLAASRDAAIELLDRQPLVRRRGRPRFIVISMRFSSACWSKR